jgi:hypothetical protein
MIPTSALALVLFAAAGIPAARAIDMPWNYAVQITATVDEGQGQVTLRWTEPEGMASNGARDPQHVVYRKAVADLGNPDWGAGTPVPVGQNYFVDAIPPGVAYEYKVTRRYSSGDPMYNGVGYVRTGIRVPLVEDRGTVLLVVESGVAGELGGDLDQLTLDLNGDGWRVIRLTDFSSGSNPSDLRARIRAEYYRDGANVRAVFLVGHLPVVMSGTQTNPDGHFVRPMPADGYYGDMNGDWGPATFDGQRWYFTRNTFPAPLSLAVGRVDFADMPAVYAASPYPSEVALLRNYLAKDHAFRLAQRTPARRALIGDAFGEYYYDGVVEPFAAEAYRNFAPLVGDAIVVKDNYRGSTNAANWLDTLTNSSFLWAYGGAAGGDTGDSMGALGPDGVTSSALVGRNAKADFYLMFGSFMVDWTKPNNLLRATLAPADYGLACAWAGRPFLYFHSMGLGETLGAAFRLSENASGSLYDTPVIERPGGNTYSGGVYLALLGDPTLRMDPVPPVSGLGANEAGVAYWNAPAGVDVTEYRVYRQSGESNAVQLEATLPPSARSYAPTQSGRHMVRAIVLQRGSGTYLNGSTGVFWDTSAANPPSTNPTPPPPPPTPPPTTNPSVPAPPATATNGLINLSSRLRISRDSAATAGFVVSGDGPKQVLVRAIGPGLSAFGIGSPVPDPQLAVLDHGGNRIAFNAGWNNDSAIARAAETVGAFKLNAGSADAAVLVTLVPGLYTAQVQSSRTGTVLVEVYAVVTDGTAKAPLVNLSTRGYVGGGAEALVGGFVISGQDPKHLLIRAIGPGLNAFGVGGTLSDPILTLRDAQGNTIAQDDNWGTGERNSVVVGPTWGDIVEANAMAGAFPLDGGSKDAVMVVQLKPGNYTATIDGANGATGGALLEVYQLP